MFKVGDVCRLDIRHFDNDETYEVVLRGPGDIGFNWTVECLAGPHPDRFHRCLSGPIVFPHSVGRWVNDSELTLLRPAQREPTRFGKFIKRIEKDAVS